MADGRDRIGIFTADGSQVTEVANREPFLVLVQREAGENAPDEMDVEIEADGSASIELELDRVVDGVATYRSGPVTLEGLRIEPDNGDPIVVRTSDGELAGTAYVDGYHLRRDALHARINADMRFWVAVGTSLKGAEQTEEVARWLDVATRKITYLGKARESLDDENDYPWVRERLGTAYADLGSPFSAPDEIDEWILQEEMARGIRVDEGAIRREGKTRVNLEYGRLWVGVLKFTVEEITDSTYTGPLYEMATGTTIYNKDGSRVGAAVEAAIGAGLDVVGARLLGGGATITQRDVAPDMPRQGRNLDAAIETGTPVHPRDAGITEGALTQFQHVGAKHDAVMAVRPANKDSLKFQEAGFPYKPMAIKQKTIQELDYHLGAPREYDGLEGAGLVGYFRPTMPSTRPTGMSDADWSALRKRYGKRLAEWEDPSIREKMTSLEEMGLVRIEDGLIIDTGLSEFVRRSPAGSMPGPDAARFAGTGTGKPLTGDYDLFGIFRRDADGALVHLSDDEAAEILEDLKDVFVKIQHGSNLAWDAGDLAHVKASIELDHTAKGTAAYDQLTAFLESKGMAPSSKGEALIVVTPEPGAPPVAYWHGHQVPESVMEELIELGVTLPDAGRLGSGAAIRVLLFRDPAPASATAADANDSATPPAPADAPPPAGVPPAVGDAGGERARRGALAVAAAVAALVIAGGLAFAVFGGSDDETPAADTGPAADDGDASDSSGGDGDAIDGGGSDSGEDASEGGVVQPESPPEPVLIQPCDHLTATDVAAFAGNDVQVPTILDEGHGLRPTDPNRSGPPGSGRYSCLFDAAGPTDGGLWISVTGPGPEYSRSWVESNVPDPVRADEDLGFPDAGLLHIEAAGGLDVIGLAEETYSFTEPTAAVGMRTADDRFVTIQGYVFWTPMPDPVARDERPTADAFEPTLLGAIEQVYQALVAAQDGGLVEADDGGTGGVDPPDAPPVDNAPAVDLFAFATPLRVGEATRVRYNIRVTNTGPVPWEATDLEDTAHGDFFGPSFGSRNTCRGQNWRLEPGDVLICGVWVDIAEPPLTGTFPIEIISTVIVDGVDDEGNGANATQDVLVEYEPGAAPLEVAKTPEPAVVSAGGDDVEFTIRVRNRSGETVELTALDDDVFGDLLDADNPAVADNACASTSTTLAALDDFVCTFRALVTSTDGSAHENTVAALVSIGDEPVASGHASAVVSFDSTS